MRISDWSSDVCSSDLFIWGTRSQRPGPYPSPHQTQLPTGTPMLNRLLTGVFGSRNERLLKQLQRIVTRINALEPQMQALSDAELQAKTPEFRERIAKGESLDKVLPEAFAVCREASVRVFGMRHFDVQLVGGM